MNMSDFTIHVTYDSKRTPKFEYIDEKGCDAEIKKKCHKRKKIQWVLDSATDGGTDIRMIFPSGNNCFNPPTTVLNSNTDYKFSDSHNTTNKYTVILLDAHGLEIDFDDPQIIFDDGTGQIPLGTLDNAVERIPAAAEQAWEKIFDKLNSAKQGERASAIQFYPHGITDIEVSVGFSGVTVTVKVSGPDS
jgi:hypothetical protein